VSETFTVSVPLNGERLDRSLALLTGLTRSDVAAIIANGAVSLDGVVVTSRHRRVQTGQEITAALEGAVPDVERAPLPNSDVPFAVLYEDADLLVINKPPGVVVHPGAGHQDDTLVSGLLAAYRAEVSIPADANSLGWSCDEAMRAAARQERATGEPERP